MKKIVISLIIFFGICHTRAAGQTGIEFLFDEDFVSIAVSERPVSPDFYTDRYVGFVSVAKRDQDIHLKGQINDVADQTLYLWITDFPNSIENDVLVDSSRVTNGQFKMSFESNNEIQFYKLSLEKDKGQVFVFVASPGDDLEYHGAIKNFRWGKLDGSRQDSLFRNLYYAQVTLSNLNNRYLDSANRAVDSVEKSHYLKLKEAAFGRFVELGIEELVNRPDSYAGMMYFVNNVFPWIGKDSSQVLFNRLSPTMKNTLLGRRAATLLELSPGGTSIIGKDFPWGKLYDVNGNEWMPATKQTNILVIMWASWCGPCREEIPDLKKLFAARKSDLAMISISLDTRESAWRDALTKENMPWDQAWSKKGFNSDIAYGTGIQSIPQLFLLDKDNRIIGEWQHLKEFMESGR